jgi:Eco57I restriction-modification methylase
MLPGFGGHLVSEAFLEEWLRAANADQLPSIDHFRRDVVRACSAAADVGPATSLRGLLHAAAVPLVSALGFDVPVQIESTPHFVVATLRHSAHSRPGASNEYQNEPRSRRNEPRSRQNEHRSRQNEQRGRQNEPRSPVVMLLVCGWGELLDPLWRSAVTYAIRCGADWSLLFNGTHLRIVDARRLYARRFVEFDLDLVPDDERSSAALLHLASASALAGGRRPLAELVRASDHHASDVCRSLKDGVLSASADLLGALLSHPRSRRDAVDGTFEQALTIVYRMLFLLFAEARLLVPLWHPVYRQSYSVEALRGCAELSAPARGLWDALRAMARLAHSGCRAGDLRVMPFNGRLFSPARTPLAERRGLDDEAARRAILAVTTRAAPDRAGRERIAYRDLGVEQLGAVYETLLDYRPRVRAAPARKRRRSAVTVTLELESGIRKATGTFYTPQPIADYVVRRTLGPLVAGLESERILRLRIVDPAMGSGAFLVAACRFLAAAYEAALIREGGCHASDLGEVERADIRRSIAERCLYGVDLNPMAAQLARLSLWLATLAADRPLTFLDHRLQTGDSLLGAWLASLRRPPEIQRRTKERRSTLPLFGEEPFRDAIRAALPIRFSLESVPTDTVERARTKERALEVMSVRDAAISRWKRVANIWCALWFGRGELAPGLYGTLSDAILTGQSALPPALAERCLSAADAIAATRRFFHWEMEFPEVFFDVGGGRLPNAGFDAVIGNPPWDMIRADAGCEGERSAARRELRALVQFTRRSGAYQAQSSGHANCYQLFVERAIDLTRAGGRIGLVLPAGLATDHGSAALRRRLVTGCNVDALVGIENHRGVFPIHRSVRFLLLTATAGSPTRAIACRLGLDDPADLETLGDEPAASSSWFPVRVTPALLEHLSGPDLAIPSLRSATDLAIAERAASLFPALGSATGWHASFGRELNATDDCDAFRLATAGADRGALPVVEGKHIEPFGVALGSVAYTIGEAEARRRLTSQRFRLPRLAYRDVAGASNRVTLIAAVLPGGCVTTHTVFCLRNALPLEAQHFLCGLFNSLMVNYLVRLRVSTHVTTAMVERLPMPMRQHAPAAFERIAVLAKRLAHGSDPEAFAQLNAMVAELYQLSRTELAHVLGTFPLIARDEREAVMNVFIERTQR